MFISAKKKYKLVVIITGIALLGSAFLVAKKQYSSADFGSSFGNKTTTAKTKLCDMQSLFETCASICKSDGIFMQSLVFPEVMRYNTLKDGIEAESLRTLYVQFGKEYANFSIGIFQMKPGFAEQVEQKTAAMLPASVNQELQLHYNSSDEYEIRRQRVERLQDEQWQLVYLTAFICICNELYKEKAFNSGLEKLQWYATVYNAGFNRTDEYIRKKINQENFYLQQQMPGKKFRYAAVAGWYYLQNTWQDKKSLF